jgi:hypothetical protein
MRRTNKLLAAASSLLEITGMLKKQLMKRLKELIMLDPACCRAIGPFNAAANG